jgi:hypothetical protein
VTVFAFGKVLNKPLFGSLKACEKHKAFPWLDATDQVAGQIILAKRSFSHLDNIPSAANNINIEVQ